MSGKTILFAMLVMLSFQLSMQQCHSDQAFYTPPKLLSYSLKPSGNSQEAVPATLSAQMSVKSIPLSDIEVHFEASQGIVLTLDNCKIEHLEPGATQSFDIGVAITASAPAGAERWVRFRIVYKPDYKKLEDLIASDVNSYPDPLERDNLLDRIREAAAKASTHTDAVRYFIKEVKE